MAISVIVFLLYLIGSVDEGIFLGWAYFLFILCAITAVVFPIIFLATNIKKAKGAIIGVVGLLVVLGLSYVLADSTIPTFMGSEDFHISETVSKNVGVGLWAMYILGGITVLSLIFSPILKLFK